MIQNLKKRILLLELSNSLIKTILEKLRTKNSNILSHNKKHYLSIPKKTKNLDELKEYLKTQKIYGSIKVSKIEIIKPAFVVFFKFPNVI